MRGKRALRISPCFAPNKAIWISKSGKFLLVESAILGIGICNSAQGIKANSTGQGIRNTVPAIQSGMHSVESIIQDCFELSYIGRHVYVSSKTSTYSFFFSHTSDTAVVILLPPDAPITSCTSPLLSVKIAADMDENGRLPGSGKLTTDG